MRAKQNSEVIFEQLLMGAKYFCGLRFFHAPRDLEVLVDIMQVAAHWGERCDGI